MASENEYIIFLDETDSTIDNVYFCLAGFIISRKDYEESLIPKINDLKLNILKSPYVVFHYKDIRKNAHDFKILNNKGIRDNFWSSLCETLSNTELITLVSYIDVQSYRKNYPKEIALSEYHILFYEIINSYIHFLSSNNGTGSIMLESRETNQNRNLQSLYSQFTQYGTNLYLPLTVREYISTLNFNIKKDNCIGLQIADMIPLVFTRKLNKRSNPYKIYDTLLSKLYTGCKLSPEGYGLIKILR